MTATDDVEAERRSRRRALLGLAGVAAAGAATVVAGAEPAGANGQGQGLTLGDPSNTATNTTGLTADVASKPALAVAHSSSGSAIEGVATTQTAIVGRSAQGHGVSGSSQGGVGVVGESVGAIGVYGKAAGVGMGVYGRADSPAGHAAGVWADNPMGTALVAAGRVPARLVPSDSAPPASPAVGSLHVDADGALRFAVDGATWQVLAGPRAAGAFHALPAPARVYDSRRGTYPPVGPKAKLAPSAARTIDLTANRSGVPSGATAALVTVLLVNAPKANGNLTVWAAGVARPQANTMVWGGDAGRFTTQATTALDAQARIQVLASHATDVVIDVVGYYA